MKQRHALHARYIHLCVHLCVFYIYWFTGIKICWLSDKHWVDVNNHLTPTLCKIHLFSLFSSLQIVARSFSPHCSMIQKPPIAPHRTKNKHSPCYNIASFSLYKLFSTFSSTGFSPPLRSGAQWPSRAPVLSQPSFMLFSIPLH